MQSILITGAGGFVGQAVAMRLAAAGLNIRRAVRGTGAADRQMVGIGASIGPDTDWRAALSGCAAVVHLAAQTPGKGIADSVFRDVNDLGTRRLAEQAAEAGVQTIVFMSSIFTIAENASQQPVSDSSTTRAVLPYGRSKLAAEAHVAAFASDGRTGISLRPPLVYGAAARGNWRLLQKIAASGMPLPFGAIRNRRTMISVDNLADAVVCALRNANPGVSSAYAVADTESVSLADIIRLLRAGMGTQARMLPFPRTLLSAALKAMGRGQMADSLLGNLEVDASRFCRTFDWRPVETSGDAIRKSGAGFRP